MPLLLIVKIQEWLSNYTVEGKAGAAVVIRNKNWRILEKGVKGDGRVAWVRVATEKGEIGFISVHGPRERGRRRDLWKWLEEKWDKGNWFFGGDWNSVETCEDSVGESPVQHGSERRRWQHLMAHQDLDDCWLATARREGPHFTRQQQVNERLDQARLDRIYYTKNEMWEGMQMYVHHDARVRLSDHRPVVVSFEKEENRGRRYCNYFKTPPELVQKPEIQQQIQEVWRNSGLPAEDLRRNWDWRWTEVRQILIAEAAKERKKTQEQRNKLQELENIRKRIAAGRDTTPSADLERLDVEIKTLELEREKELQRWSKTRWLGLADAPSKFFFSIVRTRKAKEEIMCLKAEDGRILTSQDEILRELHNFYTRLFQEDEISVQDAEKMEQVLANVENKLTEEQNGRLITRPEETEIKSLVAELKKEKAPGLDGMTAEALHSLGDAAEADVQAMIWYFWNTGQITWKQQQGVIKLLPKEGDKQLIKNWRPISLLNLGYKIIAKLLANRLKIFLPELVHSQQKGFVPGRVITDNVLAFQVGQEWAKKSKQPTLFVKLDFEKAYDRVVTRLSVEDHGCDGNSWKIHPSNKRASGGGYIQTSCHGYFLT
ncbi:hypothetical protein R1sor_001500 [Riccia sorocarpa]|uniref:EH domain-containing protein n=1 Tax=Riccia sorocarpa TaxID=122646 RepID=A0ABD3GW57_9MARC